METAKTNISAEKPLTSVMEDYLEAIFDLVYEGLHEGGRQSERLDFRAAHDRGILEYYNTEPWGSGTNKNGVSQQLS